MLTYVVYTGSPLLRLTPRSEAVGVAEVRRRAAVPQRRRGQEGGREVGEEGEAAKPLNVCGHVFRGQRLALTAAEGALRAPAMRKS